MATTKITNPDLFDIGSLDSALRLPSGTEAQRPASPSTASPRVHRPFESAARKQTFRLPIRLLAVAIFPYAQESEIGVT